ncbi:hypothetical protein B0H14DRAFT_3518710 [Mycena olivaceomarginata]|nr:hypothetical protein B0H14DRAFT_3518710 [Mycena olivaceomarginata]
MAGRRSVTQTGDGRVQSVHEVTLCLTSHHLRCLALSCNGVDVDWPCESRRRTPCLSTDPPVLGLEHTQWVWTDIVPQTATILITADNSYTLYANGVTIGSGSNFKVAQKYTVNFASTPTELVLAVLATNSAANVAGVLVAMEVNMVPTGRTGAFALTDVGWKSRKGAIPAGFEQPGFDDSAWPAVVVEATYPAAPWGALTTAAPSSIII